MTEQDAPARSAGASAKPDIAKRKAWRFSRPDAPGFADFMAGGKARKAFVKYWLNDNVWNGLHLAGHYGMKLMPMDVCSNFGARLGLFALPRYHKVAQKRARATIARLCPQMSEAGREALYIENCKAQGRLMTEFSVVNRIARQPERMVLHNPEYIQDAAKAGPIIIVGMHLGNWEIGPIILRQIGVQPYTFYVPPVERAKAWIAERVRSKTGLRFIPPGLQGIRPAVSLLKKGGVVSVFADEAFAGKIRGPLFGRAPHLEGNIALTIRLARMTGATICPWYNVRRSDGFRFDAYALPPFKLPAEAKPGERLVEDIKLLNAVIEPVVLAHLDQWYFLDNALPS